MRIQPTQLTPLYPFQSVHNFDVTLCGLGQYWDNWKPQVQPLPFAFAEIVLPSDWIVLDDEARRVDLAAYVEDVAGTTADLDRVLEAAAIEHLSQIDPAERP